LFSALDAFEHRHFTVVVVVHPHTQIHLARIGIGVEAFGNTQDGILGGEFDVLKNGCSHGVNDGKFGTARILQRLTRWA
jgi:hypothetical protein